MEAVLVSFGRRVFYAALQKRKNFTSAPSSAHCAGVILHTLRLALTVYNVQVQYLIIIGLQWDAREY